MTTIAIDGPAGAGKSTVARAVAKRLGFRYVDTGAMYRAVAHAALEREVDLADGVALAVLANEVTIDAGESNVVLDGHDITGAIRSAEVTAAVSRVAAHPEVRAALVERQRELARTADVVMEGRDIGSTVCPQAEIKIYLSASLAERALRRWNELPPDERPEVGEVASTIARRDEADSTRATAPLLKADDAYEIDTSHLTIDEVVDRIVMRAKESL